MNKIKLENWNPSVKMFTILLLIVILSFQFKIYVTMSVFISCLILMIFFSNAKIKSMAKILLPALFASFGMFIMGLYYSKTNSITNVNITEITSVSEALTSTISNNLITALQLGTRILAFAGLGTLFTLTTDKEDFISSLMHQCHLTPKFAYGILAAVHMIPNLGREYKNASFALKTRGLKVGFFSLKPTFAMLVNSIYWSENIAKAMESKGFSDNEKRTYYLNPKVKVLDLVFSSIVLIFIILGIFIAPM
jgi:energy-coupling factor transport system permease protein